MEMNMNVAKGLQFDGAVTYVSYAFMSRATPFIRVKGRWVQAFEGDVGTDRNGEKRVLQDGKWVQYSLQWYLPFLAVSRARKRM